MNMHLSKLPEMVMYREAWCAAVHGVTKSRAWLSDLNELNWIDDQVSCPLISHNWSFESKLFLKLLKSLPSINLLVINYFTPYSVVI